MAEETDGFKRVNFFTGFQTTADDWNDLVSYDVEKPTPYSPARTVKRETYHSPDGRSRTYTSYL